MIFSGLPRRAFVRARLALSALSLLSASRLLSGCAGFALSCALAVLAVPSAQAAPPGNSVVQRIQVTGAVRLAHRESSVPFSFVADGKPMGYAVDLCLRVVDALRTTLRMPQLRVEYVPVSPANRIAAIVDGKADLECGSTTNNRERRDQVAFTIPHYIAGSRMIVKADSGIRKWSDLRGKTVVSTTGTTPLVQVRKMNDSGAMGWRVVEAKDHAEAFAMVESGRADAFVMDDVLLYGLRANARNPAAYSVTGDLLTIEPYAIMLSKHDAEFKKLVDRAMIASIYDQETQKLYRKWFLSPIPPNGITLDIPMSYLLRDSFKFPSDKVAD